MRRGISSRLNADEGHTSVCVNSGNDVPKFVMLTNVRKTISICRHSRTKEIHKVWLTVMRNNIDREKERKRERLSKLEEIVLKQ
jgi:hypothetical protein